MRTIASVKNRDQLVQELVERCWGYCKDLSPETVNALENMSVASIVMTVRAVEDPANRNYPAIYDYSGVTGKMAAEITEAVKDAKFLFIESRESYLIRVFLTKYLGDTISPAVAESYGTIAEYESRQQFPREKIIKFSMILSSVLTPEEYQALCLRLGLFAKRRYSLKECAKALECSKSKVNRLYDLAIAKLWGDKLMLKRQGYSWRERRECLNKARIAQKRLLRLYDNGGYCLSH